MYKVSFCINDSSIVGGVFLVRGVVVVPRVDDIIHHHHDDDGGQAGMTTKYRVLKVHHIYEDRGWYKSKPEFGDGISVECEVITDG